MKINKACLFLWFFWCMLCIYVSNPWQYLQISPADELISFYALYLSMLILFCLVPLFFRIWLFVMNSVFKCDFTFFVKKKKGSKESIIHLSPYANTRRPEALKRHWLVLLSLISVAIKENDTIIMRSHLLTPTRVNKLIKKIKSTGVNISIDTYPRKTKLYEKVSISLVYLLFQWTVPNLHSNGMTVIIRPCQPSYIN